MRVTSIRACLLALAMAVFPEVLFTDRLRLRRLVQSDVRDVLAYASDPEVARFMTFPQASGEADVAPYLDSIQSAMDAGSEFHWAIERIGETGLVGVVSLRHLHGFEMGYVLDRAHWGLGYMPEAASALISWAWVETDEVRVWATCDIENTKSASVMKKIGMTEEGVLRRWATHPNISLVPRDCLIFGIVR